MSETYKSSIKVIESGVNTVENYFNRIVSTIFNFLIGNVSGLIKFLYEKNIIQMAIGVIIASNVGKLNIVLTEQLMNPIINRITFGKTKNIEELKINIFDIELKIGIIIVNLINFLLVMIMVYYIWQFSKVENFGFLSKILEDVKPGKGKVGVAVAV